MLGAGEGGVVSFAVGRPAARRGEFAKHVACSSKRFDRSKLQRDVSCRPITVRKPLPAAQMHDAFKNFDVTLRALRGAVSSFLARSEVDGEGSAQLSSSNLVIEEDGVLVM